MIDLDKLEAAAKAATKGRRSIEFIECDRHWLFANNVYLGAIDLRRADAEFMAHTDPSDILELIAELRQHQSTVADLSMLVQRLCRQLRRAEPAGEQYKRLTDDALDYLKRKGLQGSPLRGDQ